MKLDRHSQNTSSPKRREICILADGLVSGCCRLWAVMVSRSRSPWLVGLIRPQRTGRAHTLVPLPPLGPSWPGNHHHGKRYRHPVRSLFFLYLSTESNQVL